MKAPDKIYLHGYSFDDEPCKNWEREPKVKGMRGYPAIHVEYIRKDALMEWAKRQLATCDGAVAMRRAYDKLIDRLNSM